MIVVVVAVVERVAVVVDLGLVYFYYFVGYFVDYLMVVHYFVDY